MKKGSIQEKRHSTRYLCNKFFIQTKAETVEEILNLTAIDFNKDGMGLFSSDVIPESGQLIVTMHYHSPTFQYNFINLVCSIVHCNLTEVGSHAGISFNFHTLSEADKKALSSIEKELINTDNPEDRYDLFGEHA